MFRRFFWIWWDLFSPNCADVLWKNTQFCGSNESVEFGCETLSQGIRDGTFVIFDVPARFVELGCDGMLSLCVTFPFHSDRLGQCSIAIVKFSSCVFVLVEVVGGFV